MTLRDRLDDVADSWKPDDGDEIVGEVTGLDWRDSKYGNYRLVTIQVDEEGATEQGKPLAVGEVRTWHAYGTVAQNELDRLQLRLADRVAVRKLGMVAGKTTTFAGWRIVAERDGERLEPKAPTSDAPGGTADVSPPDEADASDRPDFDSDDEASW